MTISLMLRQVVEANPTLPARQVGRLAAYVIAAMGARLVAMVHAVLAVVTIAAGYRYLRGWIDYRT